MVPNISVQGGACTLCGSCSSRAVMLLHSVTYHLKDSNLL